MIWLQSLTYSTESESFTAEEHSTATAGPLPGSSASNLKDVKVLKAQEFGFTQQGGLGGKVTASIPLANAQGRSAAAPAHSPTLTSDSAPLLCFPAPGNMWP